MAIEYEKLLADVRRDKEKQMMPMFDLEQMASMGVLDIVALQFVPGAADYADQWKVFVEFKESDIKGYCYYTNNQDRQDVFLRALEEVEPPKEPTEVEIVNLRVVRVKTPLKRGGYFDFASANAPVKGGRKSDHAAETGTTTSSIGGGTSLSGTEEARAAQHHATPDNGGISSHLAGFPPSPIPASAAQ